MSKKVVDYLKEIKEEGIEKSTEGFEVNYDNVNEYVPCACAPHNTFQGRPSWSFKECKHESHSKCLAYSLDIVLNNNLLYYMNEEQKKLFLSTMFNKRFTLTL